MNYEEIPSPLPIYPEGTKAYIKGNVRIIFSPKENHIDEVFGSGLWKHLSISLHHRYPTWQEILDARYNFFDEDETVIQIMPPKREYINLHKNCFHLWSKIKE